MRKTIILLTILLAALTAEAKDPEEDFLSGLVRAVGTGVEASSSEDKDYISDLVGTVRRKGDNREDETDENVSTGALRFITYAYSKPSYTPPALSYAPQHAYGTGNSLFSPERGRITSGFGYRARFKRVHKGIDIAMNVGDTVRAIMSGEVKRVDYEAGGYGNFIVIEHDNGMETRYAHLSRSLVDAGQRVFSGQVIALSGNTGNSTGPHLHFETRVNGEAVNPLSLLSPASDRNRTAAGGSAAGRGTYVVRQGDTLKKISEKSGVSETRLCQLNLIARDERLQPGRMLKLR